MKTMFLARPVATTLALAALLLPAAVLAAKNATPSGAAQTGAAQLGSVQTGTAQTAPETHPLGDIPDSQAFVRYITASAGYSLEVPEGWARSGSGAGITFTSKLNQVALHSSLASPALTLAFVRSGILAPLAKADPSLKVTTLKTVQLPAGPAILARFTSAGASNEVTGRKETLENDLYVITRGAKQLVVRLSAPLNSDNVDAWNQIAHSVVWK